MLLRPRNWLYHQPYLMLALTPLFWAGNAVIGRGIHELVPPVTLAWWRWLPALLLLFPFSRKALREDWPNIRKSWKKPTVLSLLGVSCFNTLLYLALHTTYVMNAALLQSAMPAAIVLFSLLIFRERIAGLQLLGLLICMGGVVIIVCRGQWSTLVGFTFVAGDLWLLIAIASYALYSVLLRLKPEGLHPLSFLWITLSFRRTGADPALRGGPADQTTTPTGILSRGGSGLHRRVSLNPGLFVLDPWNRDAGRKPRRIVRQPCPGLCFTAGIHLPGGKTHAFSHPWPVPHCRRDATFQQVRNNPRKMVSSFCEESSLK